MDENMPVISNGYRALLILPRIELASESVGIPLPMYGLMLIQAFRVFRVFRGYCFGGCRSNVFDRRGMMVVLMICLV
jgi:hypothetical protein